MSQALGLRAHASPALLVDSVGDQSVTIRALDGFPGVALLVDSVGDQSVTIRALDGFPGGRP